MYHRLIIIALLGIASTIEDVSCYEIVASIGNPPSNATITRPPPPGPPKLLESYLAPVMQALAYHIELLQYEPLAGTTIEPPFMGSGLTDTSSTPPSAFGQWASTTQKPTSTTTNPWWQPSTSNKPTTATETPSTSSVPWWQKPTTTTTTTPFPSSSSWWQKPTTTSTTFTPPSSSIPWWQTEPSPSSTSTTLSSNTASTTTSTTTTTTTTPKPVTTTTTAAPAIESTTVPWWLTSKRPVQTLPTISTPIPWWHTSTTLSPQPASASTTGWWQTSTTPTSKPTTVWQLASSTPHPQPATASTTGWWQTSKKPIAQSSTSWWQTSKKPSSQSASTSWWQTSSTSKPPFISVATTTTQKPWWQISSTQKPNTQSPWWQTTTKKPSTSWIQQLSTTLKPQSSTGWWQTTPKPITTKPPSAVSWWQTTPKPTTTNRPTTITWWPTTAKPANYKPSTMAWPPTTSTTKKPWWDTLTTTTTRKPPAAIWWIPFSTITTTTQKPWWQNPTQNKPADEYWTGTAKPTKRPSTTWWPTAKPSTSWWSSTQPTPTWWSNTKPTTQWWQRTTTPTKRPANYWWQSTPKPWWDGTRTTTPKPWWNTQPTKPAPTIVSWDAPIWSFGNSKPASRPGFHTTINSRLDETTPFHLPGNIAPTQIPDPAVFDDFEPGQENNIDNEPQANQENIVSAAVDPYTTTRKVAALTTKKNPSDWPFDSPPLSADANFIDWLLQGKAKETKNEIEYDFSLLDPLPGSLIYDIIHEKSLPPALRDIDNVNEFLRLYDDNYGRYRPISGKKRIPPTKPYVEFLMLYDLLKREAKAMNLTNYEGYSEQMIQQLSETSKRSAEVQLHILMTKMLEQNEVKRNDVTTRIKAIIKDLENPNSVTAKSLHVIPPLQFVP